MWLLAVSCCFVAGVALAITGSFTIVVSTVISAAVWFFLAREWHLRGLVVLALCIASTFVGNWHYNESVSPRSGPQISQFNSTEKTTFSGHVATDPEADGPYQRFVLDDITVGMGQDAQSVDGKIRATLHYAAPVHYGDAVTLSGTLEAPYNFSDFDYAGYLEQQGIGSTIFCPTVERVEPPQDTSLVLRVHALSDSLTAALDSALPQPQASLAQTLLLGRRDSLSHEVRDDFARAGAAHMLAVSGLHLAIVTAAVLAIALALLGRRRYLYVWVALAAVAFYVVLTGLRPPVVRAGIMAAVFLLAELAGRQRHGATTLGFAAAVMVAIEPDLLSQTSFQLSFMAMAGLIVLYHPLREWLDAAFNRLGPDSDRPATLLAPCLDIVAATIAATTTTLPIIARTFGQVPLLSVPVSMLALPILPFAIGGAAITALVGTLSTAASVVVGWASWLPLTYLLDLSELASQQAWATMTVGPLPPYAELAYYVAVLSVAVLWRRRMRLRHDNTQRERLSENSLSRLWYAVPPLLPAIVLVWTAAATAPDGKLHVTFFEVGQGDACLIETPEGHTVVIDGGRDGVVMTQHLGAALPFWDRSIDLVVATHQHEDHLAGLLPVIRNYHVSLAVCPDYADETALRAEWGRLLLERGIPLQAGNAGLQLSLGDGTTLQIIGPPGSSATADCDDNSIVLRVCYGDVTFLLTGDIGSCAEQDLCHVTSEIDCTVLKVSHHGSDSSSCAQFLQAVTPELAVVSVGADNEYGHPAQQVLERLHSCGATVLTTADCGSIECVTDGTTVQVTTTEA